MLQPTVSFTRLEALVVLGDFHPFVADENANPIKKEEIFKGRYCGVCHDKVAFSSFVCERCHSIPHPGSPAKWW